MSSLEGTGLSVILFVELFSTFLLLGGSRFAMSSSSGRGPLTVFSRLEVAFSYLPGEDSVIKTFSTFSKLLLLHVLDACRTQLFLVAAAAAQELGFGS